MLALSNCSKTLGGKRIIDSVSCDFPPGVTVIIGSNGSGKSTLLKLIAGLLPLDAGSVSLNGEDITHAHPEDRRLGYVPQSPALFSHLTVRENVLYALRNGRGRAETGEQYLDLLELGPYRNSKPATLSGGFQSRVSLARALAAEPRAMLLDEPLSALDQGIKERLAERFATILRHLDIPVLYVTHDPMESECMGDYFALIGEERLEKAASPAEAFSRLGGGFR